MSVDPKAVTFSVNSYDRDGDILDDGVFLHFGNTAIKVADNFQDFLVFTEKIEKIKKEISESYWGNKQ